MTKSNTYERTARNQGCKRHASVQKLLVQHGYLCCTYLPAQLGQIGALASDKARPELSLLESPFGRLHGLGDCQRRQSCCDTSAICTQCTWHTRAIRSYHIKGGKIMDACKKLRSNEPSLGNDVMLDTK